MLAIQAGCSRQQRATLARASPHPATAGPRPAPCPAPAARPGADALGRRLAGAVQRRATAARALLQRANDKFAVTFGTDASAPEQVARLRDELGAIYRLERASKSRARNALDVAQAQAVFRLADRQEALAALAFPAACEELNRVHKLELKPKPGAAVGDARNLLGQHDVGDVARAVAAGIGSQIVDARRATEELKEHAIQTEQALLAELKPLMGGDDGGELYAKVLEQLRARLREKYRIAMTTSAPKYAPSQLDRFRSDVATLTGQAVQAKLKGQELDLGPELLKFRPEERAYVEYRVLSRLREVRRPAPRTKAKQPSSASTPVQPPVEEPPLALLQEVADPYAELDAGLKAKIDKLATGAMAAVEQRLAAVERAHATVARGRVDVNKVEMITREHARHHLSDPAVVAYEKGYLASGMDLKRVKELWARAAIVHGFELRYVDRGDHTEILAAPTGAGSTKPTVVGQLYLDDQRFAPSPLAAPRQVFVHRETGEQYVQDARDLFVRRFVLRSLNTFDNTSAAFGTITIDVDARSKKLTDERWAEIAQALPARQATEVDDEVWKHQRQKELQGGSPFVSATTTRHPIFGSTAKYFEDPTGMAKIDLAVIPKERVVDTHQPRAYTRITTLGAPDIDMPFQEGVLAWERNSAVRDAIRTREVVIIGSVPSGAVVEFSTPDGGGGARKRYAPDIDHGGARFLDPAAVAKEEQRRRDWEDYMAKRRGLDEI